MTVAGGGIVGILLAGGRSLRFGSDKLLQPLPDATPVAVTAARKLVVACPRSISVLRPEQGELRDLLSAAGIEVLLDRAPDHGMGSNLACAVRHCADADGWLVALADMPFIMPATLQALVAALRDGAELVAPRSDGRRGHPVGFARRWLQALVALHGEHGARHIIEAHAQSLRLIDVDDPGIHRDIDTPLDLPAPR